MILSLLLSSELVTYRTRKETLEQAFDQPTGRFYKHGQAILVTTPPDAAWQFLQVSQDNIGLSYSKKNVKTYKQKSILN